jgi:hypothetical protein
MFQYTTIDRIRGQGFNTGQVSDADALPLIQDASQILTDILGQWFNPVREKKFLDGHGSSLIYYPNRIPFIEVISLGERFTATADGSFLPRRIDVLVGSGDRVVYNPDEFYIRGRYIELNYSNSFDGRANVEIDAYTGFLDWFDVSAQNQSIRKEETDLTTQVSNDDTEAIVTSVDNFRPRDILLFEKNDTSREVLAFAIVNSIDRSTTKFEMDEIKTLNEQDLPIGTKVVTFGAVPNLIERATILILKKLVYGYGTNNYEDLVFGTKLKGEKTDRYSYTLFGDKDGGGIGITGDTLIDSQLGKFSEPDNVDIV